MSTPTRLMAHMIPFYPDVDRSRRVARALVDAGAAILEIQFPYSDPTADGPVIQGACSAALAAGFTADAGLAFIDSLQASGAPPIIAMSYAGMVFARGIDRFVGDLADRGVMGLIVPDLPVDADEGLYAAGRERGVAIVPVISFGADDRRIELVRAAAAGPIYASIRRGVTGRRSEIDDQTRAFLAKLAGGGRQVLAGFGVRDREQVVALAPHVDAVIVGSALVASIPAEGDPYDPVFAKASELIGGPIDHATGSA